MLYGLIFSQLVIGSLMMMIVMVYSGLMEAQISDVATVMRKVI